MENGGWRMENGGWRMEDGGWRMEDGEWRMENGKRYDIPWGQARAERRPARCASLSDTVPLPEGAGWIPNLFGRKPREVALE